MDKTTEPRKDVTALLQAWSAGDPEAGNELMETIYAELRKIASGYLRRERSEHTLQVTALVHEAYLRLIDQDRMEWRNRKQLYGVTAQLMRRILVDHARASSGPRRGGGQIRVELKPDCMGSAELRSEEVLTLHHGLQTLAKIDQGKAKIVELRYFGGLQVQEIAEVLEISIPTVNRRWRSARAWLYHWLADKGPATGPAADNKHGSGRGVT